MSLVLKLPQELATALTAEPAKLGLPLEEYALRLLVRGHGQSPVVSKGGELVAYWQSEGVIGTRSVEVDSPAYARQLREQAQRRSGS